MARRGLGGKRDIRCLQLFFVQPGELFCALLHDICVCVCVFGANIDNNLELENIFNFVYTGIFAAQAVGP